MVDEELLAVCHETADAVALALRGVADWAPAGERPGQYAIDLVADAAALEVLSAAGLGILSEESGRHRGAAHLVAVVDPVDGSTNASRGIPWYATSICILDAVGPLVAVVANQASGVRYQAVRGGGAWCGDRRLVPSGCRDINEAIVGLSGYPLRHLGWSQFRSLGAAALDLCAVAEGVLDAYAVVGGSALGSWDYLGGMLVCIEAGAVVESLEGQDLVTTEHSARRSLAAAATPDLLGALTEAATRAASPDPPS